MYQLHVGDQAQSRQAWSHRREEQQHAAGRRGSVGQQGARHEHDRQVRLHCVLKDGGSTHVHV